MFILIPPGFFPERTALAADLDSPFFGSPEIGTKEKDGGWEAWIRTRIPCSKGTCPTLGRPPKDSVSSSDGGTAGGSDHQLFLIRRPGERLSLKSLPSARQAVERLL